MNRLALLLALIVPLATAAEPSPTTTAPTSPATAPATDASPAKELAQVEAIPPAEDRAGRALYPPRFPASALRNCEYGIVRLRVTIDAAGRVLNVAIDGSSGSDALDEAAAEAAAHWRFNAGYSNGVKVGGDIIVPVNFQNPC